MPVSKTPVGKKKNKMSKTVQYCCNKLRMQVWKNSDIEMRKNSFTSNLFNAKENQHEKHLFTAFAMDEHE